MRESTSTPKATTLEALSGKVDFFVRTSLPPKEGIFFNGHIFYAYTLVADIIRKAKKRIVLIDNYVDEEVYHIGASLKDLRRKLFGFSKMEVMTGTQLLSQL